MKIVQISSLMFCIHLGNMYATDYDDNRCEMNDWLEKNIKRTYLSRGIYVSFKSKYDATAFKLRWM